VAQAAAAGTVKLHIVGPGSGEVTSGEGGEGVGTPPMECSGPPATGTCENELEVLEETIELELLKAIPDPGSEFVEWTFQEGEGLFGSCPESACLIGHFEPTEEPFELTVKFGIAGPSEFPLSITESGSGAGTVECEVDSGPAEACAAEYAEGTSVKLKATADAGSEFTGFSGICTGSTCELTMSSAKSVTATFDLEPTVEFPLTVTTSGSGSGEVECDSGGGPEACAAE